MCDPKRPHDTCVAEGSGVCKDIMYEIQRTITIQTADCKAEVIILVDKNGQVFARLLGDCSDARDTCKLGVIKKDRTPSFLKGDRI